MLEQFTDDAELVFEGVALGPFRGREAILEAYRAQAPDDEVRISRPRRSPSGEELVVDYAWAREPHLHAGEMRFLVRDGAISRLTVTFDPPRGSFGSPPHSPRFSSDGNTAA